MLTIKTLLPELRRLVAQLAEDLLARATSDATIDAGLREAFQKIEEGGRTAQAYEVWRDDYLDQVAVAWVLACVFVRFMEDNGLIDECWLAGEGPRRKLAEDTHELFFRQHPHDTDREYFQHVFHEVGKIPAARDLFAEGKTPLWAVAPSGDAAMNLLKFWREMNPENGKLRRVFNHETHETHEKENSSDSSFRAFRGPDILDTRFLGDLYQELSERAKKKFALLQTPVFVEEFILDRTLTPALAEFGLEKIRMIDPTCGSGHFLLGGFARLFDLWSRPEHTTGNADTDAQKALDGVWGVDINPFAVAIARFRLIVAAVQACGIKRLKKAPGWNIHLASGDSLLFGSRPGFDGSRVAIGQQLNLFEVPAIYATEDRKALQEILGQGYHVVVGNPPYITVKDKAQNEAYRRTFPQVCHRQYSLAVPFTQRFWGLALQHGEGGAVAAGHIGMITANSFMKREFGKKLIEDFFPKFDLSHVIDTSGAYIPGHGTPTVILFGHNQKPVGETIRAVLGIKGEPSTPDDPSQGLVWQSIVSQIDTANAQDAFTSTADVPRTTFASHPWSIGGGGAADLKEQIESDCEETLETRDCKIGFLVITGEDNCLVLEPDVAKRIGLGKTMPLVLGDEIRDWSLTNNLVCLWPCDAQGRRLTMDAIPEHLRFCWSYRAVLRERKAFGVPVEEKGIPWWALRELYADRLRTPLSITFAFVATHNHFVFDRGGKVFNRTAPIIKLPADATEDDHLALLGLLNSSTACFWLHQVCFCKDGKGEHWARRYEHDGGKVSDFPLPESRPLNLSRQLDDRALQYAALLPESVAQSSTPTSDRITKSRSEAASIRGRMIALQEELDWECYRLYGLIEEDLTQRREDAKKTEEGNADSDSSHLCASAPLREPPLQLGQRAFEIVLARKLAAGETQTTWFARHGSTPITELPAEWPDD